MKLHKFSPEGELGRALGHWHRELRENRGDRATLRRAATGIEAAMLPAAHRLIATLRAVDPSINVTHLPELAALLAHIKEADSDKILPLQLAEKREGRDQPKFSELRLRRLLQSDDRDGLCSALRRAIALLRGCADIYSTAETVYCWGDRMRRDWSYAYFGALTPRFAGSNKS